MSKAYEAIAAKLLAMTDDAGNWRPCWHRSGLTMPRNYTTKAAYRGANILSTWISCEMNGYQHNQWATFKQWLEAGAVVRKGEKGTPIVFFGTHERENDDGEKSRYQFARGATVFNVAQVKPLDDHPKPFVPPEDQPPPTPNPDDAIANVEAFAHATGARIVTQPCTPCYIPALDEIRMPAFDVFHHAVGYYGTLLHELTHWTGAKHRLDRELRQERSKYALEELVAELGAAFLCADLGIEAEPRPDHAQYLAHWHDILKKDVPAFMSAVSKASAAADYLHGLQQEQRAAA